jgi:hypothetical protein
MMTMIQTVMYCVQSEAEAGVLEAVQAVAEVQARQPAWQAVQVVAAR